MLKTAWHNLRTSYSKLDTLLAWLAIFVWVFEYTWRVTELDGLTDTLRRLGSWDWADWSPITGGDWYMIASSCFYWFGIAMALVVFVLLVRKIFMRPENESVDEIRQSLSGIQASIDRLTDEIRKDREGRDGERKPDV